jgi:hypothetical protein
MERATISLFFVARVSFALIAAAVGSALSAQAQPSGDDVATALRDNVVRLRADWEAGSNQDGFGFIVAEREGKALIATANHVVRTDGVAANRVTVWYFQDQGHKIAADILETSSPDLDLALLEAPLPAEVSWHRDSLSATEPARGLRLWFVGRTGFWDIPAQPGTMSKVSTTKPEMQIEGLNVEVGTSGSPLIGETGIVGMIIRDTGTVAIATPITAIKNAMMEWNLPFELAEAHPNISPWPQTSKGDIGRLAGDAIVPDGNMDYEKSGYSFFNRENVPWNAPNADILVATIDQTNRTGIQFFLPFDVPPYNAQQDSHASSGIRQATRPFDDLKTCPSSAEYEHHWFLPQLDGVYCVRTRNGDRFVKIKVETISKDKIEFSWAILQ